MELGLYRHNSSFNFKSWNYSSEIKVLSGKRQIRVTEAEARASLDELAQQGWRLIALTNSGQGAVDAQLHASGLHQRFEAVLSVDSVRAFKPAAAPYRLALATASVDASDAIMVAAHDWDLAGAKSVGMQTALIARPGMPFSMAYPPAD